MGKHHAIVSLNNPISHPVAVRLVDHLSFWRMPQRHHKIVCTLPLSLLEALHIATSYLCTLCKRPQLLMYVDSLQENMDLECIALRARRYRLGVYRCSARDSSVHSSDLSVLEHRAKASARAIAPCMRSSVSIVAAIELSRCNLVSAPSAEIVPDCEW